MDDQDALERAINERIEICDYSSLWPSAFTREADRLGQLCGTALRRIEHVGSTAVRGLAAKPIIDIIALVDSLEVADNLVPLLCANGYTTSAEFNAAQGERRWLMRQQEGRRTHHLHLLVASSLDWERTIRFRDLLRSDYTVRSEYLELKRQLAEFHAHDREAYTKGKSEFIERWIGQGHGSNGSPCPNVAQNE